SSCKCAFLRDYGKDLLSAPYAPDDGSLSAAQDSRRKTLQDVCSRYQPDVLSRRVSQRQVSRVYVEDRHRLLYCEVPKSGCSNWKRVLMVLNGRARSTGDIPHEQAHYGNKLQRLEAYDQAGIAKRLDTYARVLFVREPFERLVSAFRDKFESPNSYYHPVFGRPIISKYRANATRAALRTGAGVTFREFVRYLLDVKRPVGMDIHWEPVSQMCSPCLMRYSFIGKFENLEKEANFLLRNIGQNVLLNPIAIKNLKKKVGRSDFVLEEVDRSKSNPMTINNVQTVLGQGTSHTLILYTVLSDQKRHLNSNYDKGI
uniref:Carbohydrate sulfotransferase n=1 Tax=Neogobius melanostomus TaxID=47308 RepID=A0A8C6WM44_9GOBI